MTSPAARSPAAELLHLLGRSGPARLRVWPVTDHDRLSRLIAVLTRIDGVGAIAVERFDGHDALLLAQVEHAASADEILTARLARGMLACGVRDGRIEVQLVARSTGAPPPPGAATPGRFDVPPGLRSLRITPPLRGPVPPRGDDR
ncbi:hypothetical protein, partial [Patulibacter sp.]|uniref:hypothetical protein n=1 Tax=Patulibacter sp. TaxID=1912859 RepID=UPI00271F0DA5